MSFAVDASPKTRARLILNSVPEVTIEDVKRRCAETASEMQCPFHQRNARVIMDGDRVDRLEIEIICCCDRFVTRVRDALEQTISQS
jgi:hypothetical protein